MLLHGKAALVTGAARGIGKAIALRLAEEGAAVALVDLRGAAETAQAMREKGFKASGYEVDVADSEAVAAVIASAVKDLGSLDISRDSTPGS